MICIFYNIQAFYINMIDLNESPRDNNDNITRDDYYVENTFELFSG